MDNMSKRQRSFTMARIRSKNTTPERKIRSALFKMGFRYRKCVKDLPGTPDIVLKKFKAVIFVNGCFWHHHAGCFKAVIPKTNRVYWEQKIQGNVAKDLTNTVALQALGWRVITIWECEINSDLSSVMSKIITFLRQGASGGKAPLVSERLMG